MRKLSQRRLDELLDFWQGALRLADWDIEAKTATRRALNGDDGECSAYPTLREAEIRVVSCAPSSKFADHETILVHELYHCHFEPFRTDKNEQEIERTIEALSKATVALRRMAA